MQYSILHYQDVKRQPRCFGYEPEFFNSNSLLNVHCWSRNKKLLKVDTIWDLQSALTFSNEKGF